MRLLKLFLMKELIILRFYCNKIYRCHYIAHADYTNIAFLMNNVLCHRYATNKEGRLGQVSMGMGRIHQSRRD